MSSRRYFLMVCLVILAGNGTGRSDVILNGSEGLSVTLSQVKSWTIGRLYFDGYGICLADGSGQGTVVKDTDWAGSVHGRETVHKTQLWVDGVERPFLDGSTYDGTSFVFERRTTLGDIVGLVSRTELLGTRIRERVTLTRLESPSSLTVAYGFLGTRADTLIEYASFDDEARILDQGLTNSNDSTFTQLPNAETVAQYDPLEEIGILTTVCKGADLGLRMFIWDRNGDNKLYSRFFGMEYSPPSEVFDIEQVMTVFQADSADWQAAAGVLATRGAALSCDADHNNVIDAADYIALKTHMGQCSGAVTDTGDFDLDGDVDWDDMHLLELSYASTIAGASETIPEPAMLYILTMGGMLLQWRRSGHKSGRR